MTTPIYLEKRIPARNQQRFYIIAVTHTLFGRGRSSGSGAGSASRARCGRRGSRPKARLVRRASSGANERKDAATAPWADNREAHPYFGLSISRVDPLPYQLEAIYDSLLEVARERFLLADDAGAGKTIMSGLLIRELVLRGLAERILIVCPANLAFQWPRELQEKFDAKFLVMKGQDIRDQFGANQWLERHRVIASLDLAKRSEILPGLRQVHGDLVMVDEAHRRSAADESYQSRRYRWANCYATALKQAMNP